MYHSGTWDDIVTNKAQEEEELLIRLLQHQVCGEETLLLTF
jgi:hypothetical protein